MTAWRFRRGCDRQGNSAVQGRHIIFPDAAGFARLYQAAHFVTALLDRSGRQSDKLAYATPIEAGVASAPSAECSSILNARRRSPLGEPPRSGDTLNTAYWRCDGRHGQPEARRTALQAPTPRNQRSKDSGQVRSAEGIPGGRRTPKAACYLPFVCPLRL